MRVELVTFGLVVSAVFQLPFAACAKDCNELVLEKFDNPGSVVLFVEWIAPDGAVLASDRVSVSEDPSIAVPDFPFVARAAQIEGTVIVEGEIDESGTVKNGRVVDAVHPLVDDAALSAFRASEFIFDGQGQTGSPIRVRVLYEFAVEPLPYVQAEPLGPLPSDEELEVRAGKSLPEGLHKVIESTKSVFIVKLCWKGSRQREADGQNGATRGFDFRGADGTSLSYLVLCNEVELDVDQVQEFRGLFLDRSPYWLADRDDCELLEQQRQLKSWGPYAFLIVSGDDEVLLKLGSGKSSQIEFSSESRYWCRGNPYERTRQLLCGLVASCYGESCN